MQLKICAKCKEIKPLEEFHRDAHTKTKRASRCKKCRMKGTRKPLAERFWSKVNRLGESDCWEWTGAKFGNFGYGGFYFRGKVVQSHRVCWIITNGEIKTGLLVLHKCDNPKCVNPNHLFLGTQKDNTKDMIEKGRSHWQKNPPPPKVYLGIARGERSNKNKLTKEIVLKIREQKKRGESLSKLAKKYSVDQSTISLIVNKKRWTHI